MNPMRLLLVEDDAVSRSFLDHALRALPATVDAAADAAQARALARDHLHALWLIDANLPDASGEQLLRDLRGLRADVPALCLTAEVQRERLDGLRTAGFIEVLQKPLTIAALHAAVAHALDANPSTRCAGSACATLPLWDDQQALRALGGNVDAMHAMRALFMAELPNQSVIIARAIADGNTDSVRAELHRLKASCGFVGSARLLEAVRALHDAPMDPACAQCFQEQVAEALAAVQSGC